MPCNLAICEIIGRRFSGSKSWPAQQSYSCSRVVDASIAASGALGEVRRAGWAEVPGVLGVSEVSVYETGELRKKYPIVRPVGRPATIAFRSRAQLPGLQGQ